MLKRAAYERLVSWKKDPHHRALLVDGARQVGKTYLVRAFAQRHYGTTIEINFVESPEAKAIFAGNLDADTLIPQLSAFSGTALTPGDTLIFLDEIQECPRARTAIKFLVEDGRFDYIESGSLLGVTYENVPSLPSRNSAGPSEKTRQPSRWRARVSRKKPPCPPSSTRSSWSCSSTT